MAINQKNSDISTENRRLKMPICDRSVAIELSNDYTLSDYQQEIRRILYVNATIPNTTRYVSAAGAEINGVVDYNLIYVGTDGLLYSIPLVAEYSANLPIDNDSKFDFNEGITFCCDITTDNITTRLSGVRKLNIKCRLAAHVRAYAVLLMDEKLSGDFSEEHIQTLDICRNNCTFLRQVNDNVSLSAEIFTETNSCRVIGASGNVFISEANCSGDNVTVRGEVYLKIIAEQSDSSSSITQIVRCVPFSDIIQFEEDLIDSNCSVNGVVNDISGYFSTILPNFQAFVKNSMRWP